MASVPVSVLSAPTRPEVVPEANRRSANYSPSIWGDRFLSCASDFMEAKDKIEHQKLKEELKRMLASKVDKTSWRLDLIDAIQRLGVSYHFESEIEEILREVNNSHHGLDEGDNDLHTISLKFRLLRQQGYKFSSDIFKVFIDSQGNFKDSLIANARGMLSLYEAAHLRVHGEDILDKALAFTIPRLESMKTHLNSPLASQVNHALKRPIRKGIPRLEARHYISIYEQDASRNEVLLTFAKLDFNILQQIHRIELSDIAKWWKELDVSNKLPFARDRIAECYFWILGIYYKPEYCLARRITTKVIAMTSIIDDIYDVYGTPEELELFTTAIERWDIRAMHQLPEYMQLCYKALLDVYTEIEENMINEGRSYRVFYAKEAMKDLVRAYFLESKWFHQQCIPTMEEYMSITLVTTGYPMLATISHVGMGNLVTKDTFDWLSRKPKIVTASSIICRLMDDIVSHKFEQKRGHVASGISCFMKQYGATEEEVVLEFQKQITDAWKDINEECLYPTAVPMPLLTRILNFARVMDGLYKEEDGYTHADVMMKDFVCSVLIDPVSV